MIVRDGIAGPLAGITVVAVEQVVAAPLCTRVLGDLGARVIKIENPDGGDVVRHFDSVVNGLGAHFVWLNRGKESVALDLKSESGMRALSALLATSDILVSNLGPGAMDRLGLGSERLAADFPDLIAVEIDGYGSGGPLSDKRSYDLLAQAESGSCSITGSADAPAKPGPPVADASAALYAVIAILGALLARNRSPSSGIGRRISVSLFDAMTDMMGYAYTYALHSGTNPARVGLGSPAVAPYSGYTTKDDRTVVLGVTSDREWSRLASLLGRPELAADPRYRTNELRVMHRDALDEIIGAWCAARLFAEIEQLADRAGIGNARLNTALEAVHHPHLETRERWRSIGTPAGPVPTLLPPADISGYEPRLGSVPALGEHTRAVLAELNVDRDSA